MTEREALKLALEALEIEEAQTHYPSQWLLKAITAIKEALAQPEQTDEKGRPMTYWGGMAQTEALRLALEHGSFPQGSGVIHAIKEALAQPEQEPVVWMYQDKSTHEVRFQKHMRDFVDHSKIFEVPLYSEPLANHELQCVCGAVWCGDEMVHLPNKAPPQRTWVGLPMEEFKFIASKYLLSREVGLEYFQEEIEAKLKEKNT